MELVTRREALFGTLLLPAAFIPAAIDDTLNDLEKRSGGRLGVAVLDTGNGTRARHRADERFPMCSTFKLLAVAAVLARVDRGVERLNRRVPFSAVDLLEYAPVTRPRVGEGGMPMADTSATAEARNAVIADVARLLATHAD